MIIKMDTFFSRTCLLDHGDFVSSESMLSFYSGFEHNKNDCQAKVVISFQNKVRI